jgi:hypothetical protein
MKMLIKNESKNRKSKKYTIRMRNEELKEHRRKNPGH